ncbi:hypothetical protein SY27_11295 [Flavobacterium sp. 316]|uniref:hypothetical protein n=1 Tax=Flavobacterium sp. 316 TaxID=1603293 RepID=UPI0005E051B4|nr:hypothetical protein [Flavobacterium sp. 316]KIX20495.1 hypothetical protein SY27_11295 [Flavobacterium sp. 316]
MKYRIFVKLFLISFVVGCSNSNTTNKFLLKIDSVIQETDSIHVFYTTNSTIEFNEKASFWKKVNGSSKNQKIEFLFPDTILPKQIRMDLGNNINQQEIVLNKVDFQYKNKSFSLQGKEIYYYFRIDESVTELDKELGTLKRRDSLQARGPSLYPKGDNLFNKLSKFQND